MARRYSGITRVALGAFPQLNRSANVGDVAVGVGLGIVGSAGVKAVLGKFAPGVLASAEGMAGKATPLLTGLAAGAALYYGQKKSSRGFGHAVGAVAAGLTLTVVEFLRGQSFFGLNFSEVTAVNLGGYRGLLVPDHTDARMNGLLVADNTDSRLNELAAMSMGADDDGIASLVG